MSIPGRTSSVPTARRTTNGEGVVKTSPARGLLLLALLAATGCAENQPTERDFQVMEAAHKAESDQAQRTILGLRAEVQGLQKELSVSRMSLARLEGELRDARGRLTEAQRTMDSQRDELSRLREERERMVQTAREIQGQLVELGRLRQQVADAAREQPRMKMLEEALEKQSQALAEIKVSMQKSVARSKRRPAPAADFGIKGAAYSGASGSPSRVVTVQAGDTLSAIARDHGVALRELKALNDIMNADLIFPGQELLLPGAPPE